MPSDSRIDARFSRSAFIWRVMASTMSRGGRMSFNSTRVIFTPHGLGRMVDDREQPGIDLVALRQGLIEVHRPHHGAQVRRRERHDRHIEIADLIGGLGGVQHLEEDDAVDRDHRIVLGDDLLAGDIDHLLHHVDLVADAIEERRDEVEAGLGDADETAEMLDRIAIALVDDLHADHHVEQHQDRNRGHERSQHLYPPMRHFDAYCCERPQERKENRR